MKNSLKIVLAAAAFLTACAPLSIYYKEGETVAQMDRDRTECDVTAYRQVPADIRTRYIPPTYDSYRTCNPLGHCTWHRVILSPGRFERYDANLSLREKVAALCMADQGYVLTRIKRCDAAITRAADLRATRVMPPINSRSCSIRLKSGRWQIITPEEG